jgi:hypothetical protein
VRRTLGVVAVVIAAMAIGRLLTDHFPDEEKLAEPFVQHGSLGEPVHLRYGDVRVTGVRVGTRLEGADVVEAAGRFLIVDLAYRAEGEPRRFLGLEVWDAHGRRYDVTTRGSTCPPNLEGLTGIRMYAMTCFDVPRSALAGAKFRFSLGDYGVNGSGQRRDDLAEIDLGISRADAARLWRQNLTYKVSSGAATAPLDTRPITLEKPGWWAEPR